MVLTVLFWILLILLAIGVFVPDDPARPWGNRARGVVVLILIGLLGWAVFGGIERPSRRSDLPQGQAAANA